ncbi:MAG: hypothetical protein QOH60_474 [Mycobacterium sp.]|jgi:hypothetical protein|nr:hypothetical protein [Mycobacterium sp.]
MNKVQRGTRLGRIAALLVVAFAAVGVPTAQAYDVWSCPGDFRSKVVQFKMEGGVGDFGDDLHLGGAPQGTAVACWDGNVQNANASRVFLKGKSYLDLPSVVLPDLPGLPPGGGTVAGPVCTFATIRFVNANGTVRATRTTPELCGTTGLKSRDVNEAVNVPVTTIRLDLSARFSNSIGDPPHTEVVKTVHVRFR